MNAAELSATSGWPMFRTLVGIGVICSVLIVSVYRFTAPAIEQNQTALLDEAIGSIFPNAETKIAYQQRRDGQFTPSTADQKSTQQLFAVFDRHQQLLGFAIKAQGMGYQDTIQLLYGYAPQQQAIIGIKILSSRETPGLGDRISKDPQFLRNFEHLAVTLTADKSNLLHNIESVKPGTKNKPWQIDSISGATISSRALTDILRGSTEQWIPALANHLESFQLGNKNNSN